MTTVLQVIEDAMVEAGLLLEGASSTAANQTKYIRRLNDVINLAQTQGLKLWLERDISITLVSGTPSYTVTSGGLRVPRISLAYWVDSSGARRDVGIISREQYTRLQNTTTSGSIQSIFPEKLITSTKVWCWMIPDATAAAGALHVIGQVEATNVTLTTDDMTIVFPKEWASFLMWGLAAEICGGQPQETVQRCESRAAAFRKALEDWDVEDAPTSFAPSISNQTPSRFQ